MLWTYEKTGWIIVLSYFFIISYYENFLYYLPLSVRYGTGTSLFQGEKTTQPIAWPSFKPINGHTSLWSSLGRMRLSSETHKRPKSRNSEVLVSGPQKRDMDYGWAHLFDLEASRYGNRHGWRQAKAEPSKAQGRDLGCWAGVC